MLGVCMLFGIFGTAAENPEKSPPHSLTLAACVGRPGTYDLPTAEPTMLNAWRASAGGTVATSIFVIITRKTDRREIERLISEVKGLRKKATEPDEQRDVASRKRPVQHGGIIYFPQPPQRQLRPAPKIMKQSATARPSLSH